MSDDPRGPLSFGDERPIAGGTGEPQGPGEPAHAAPAAQRRLPRILLAVAGLALLALVTVNTLRTDGASSTGPPPGSVMTPFAAPLATSSLVGDVNVARRAGQGPAGAVAACDVRGAAVLNSCDLVDGRPAVLVFFTASKARCVAQVDRLAAAAVGQPGVRVAAITLGGDRRTLRELVLAHDWTIPVAHDRDAVLGNLYGVVVCPQITELRAGGRVGATTVGELSQAALDQRLATLAAGGSR